MTPERNVMWGRTQRKLLHVDRLIGEGPHSAVAKESTYHAGDPSLIPGSGRSRRRNKLPTPAFLGFPGGSAYNVGDLGSIPRLGRVSGEGKGYLL